MTHFLSLQADYHGITIGIYQETSALQTVSIPKMNANQLLMPTILNMLSTTQLTFESLAFIAVNQGPAPFTTLRIVITTANGLNFARQIPLVGVDALHTFIQEKHGDTDVTIALLNAFSQDVYFAINNHAKKDGLDIGWSSIQEFFQKYSDKFPFQSITFIGNAITLYKEQIEEHFKDVHFVTPNPEYTNFDACSRAAYKQWQEKRNVCATLLPLYLKMQEYKTAM